MLLPRVCPSSAIYLVVLCKILLWIVIYNHRCTSTRKGQRAPEDKNTVHALSPQHIRSRLVVKEAGVLEIIQISLHHLHKAETEFVQLIGSPQSCSCLFARLRLEVRALRVYEYKFVMRKALVSNLILMDPYLSRLVQLLRFLINGFQRVAQGSSDMHFLEFLNRANVQYVWNVALPNRLHQLTGMSTLDALILSN